jgi:hypothetical protein
VWREQALAEIAAREFLVARLQERAPEDRPFPQEAVHRIQGYLDAAKDAARGTGLTRRERIASALRGASVERTWGQINAAEEAILQVAPDDYVKGQLPRLLARVQRSLAADDPRRLRLESIVRRHEVAHMSEADGRVVARLLSWGFAEGNLDDAERKGLVEVVNGDTPCDAVLDTDREGALAALHAANCAARRAQTRVRSFRNLLYICAVALTVAAVAFAVLGAVRPDLAPLCFQPSGLVVCPTDVNTVDPSSGATGQPATGETAADAAKQDEVARNTADPIDVLFVEVTGLIAAALAAAAALRDMRGTSTPYGVPLALAVLKLPTGALTATLGLLLMRGQFIPGLTALDSPAQIIAWAIVLGYAQQLFTRFVDQRAHTVLESAGGQERAESPTVPALRAPGTPRLAPESL